METVLPETETWQRSAVSLNMIRTQLSTRGELLAEHSTVKGTSWFMTYKYIGMSGSVMHDLLLNVPDPPTVGLNQIHKSALLTSAVPRLDSTAMRFRRRIYGTAWLNIVSA